MSYVYTAVAVYYDPDDPLRFKNLSKTPTVTAKDLSTGTAIAGATVSNVDTGNYKVSVTYANKESVLFKIIPHNDDKDDFPDVSLLAEEVRFVADDILADTGDLKMRLTAARAGYLDKLNVAGTLAHSGAASTYKADVSGLATTSALSTTDGKVDAILADTGTDGVKIASAQGAITWGQQKIVANVAGEGALDIVNTNLAGIGQRNYANNSSQGSTARGMVNSGYINGQLNFGGVDSGLKNASSGGVGQHNSGAAGGVKNISFSNPAIYNEGSIGTYNKGTDTAGVQNEGTTIGEYNVSADGIGQLNAGDTQNVEGFDPAIALEATLTAIKGSGWDDENLVALMEAIDAIEGGGLDAAGVRSAVGLASANLDTQLSGIKTDTGNIQTDTNNVANRLTSTRAGYLDKLNVAGTLANTTNAGDFKADTTGLAKTTDLSGLATSSALSTVDGKVDGIKARTDNLPNSPAATGDAMTLTGAYDKAKDDVLTPLAAVDGKADAIKAKTDKIPNLPAEAGEYTSALTDIQTDLDNPSQYKADVSGLALEATLTAIKGANWTDETLVTIKDIVDNISSGALTTAGIRTAIGLASNNLDAQLSAIQSDLDDPSQYKADVSGLATSGALTTVDGKVNAIKAKTDNLPVSPAATGDKMLLDADALDATAIKADAVAKLQDGLALESTLSEIKGVGWTDETLKAIKDATGGGGLDAQGVRDAVGLANANLDTQLEAIQDDLDDPNQYKADVSGLATSAALSSVDGKVDSIKAATDKIPNTPAVAGEYDGALAAIQDDLDDPDQYKADVSAIVNILEDIKGAGWTDETLEAIADAITNVPGGEGVLEALESIRSELRQYSAVRRHLKCDRLEIKRATDATIEVFGVGDLTGRSSLYFTVKYMKDKDTAADMHSVIQIEETAGLLYINQVEADTPANGSIVVSDALAGTMTIKLSAAETDKLTPNESYVYDIKMDNDVMAEGKLLISTAVTRTVT